MKKQNEGVRAYQEAQRQETLAKVDEAYKYLKQTHQTITKTAISMESGVALRTLHKPYVQQHLLRYPEFNPSIEQSSSTAKLEDSLKEIERLKALLSKSRNQNRRISAELLAYKAKCKDLELQNERLAGQCQKLGEMKLIRL